MTTMMFMARLPGTRVHADVVEGCEAAFLVDLDMLVEEVGGKGKLTLRMTMRCERGRWYLPLLATAHLN